MFSPLRNRFGIPGVISVIALVFAMFGGAWAASGDGGSDGATASAKRKGKKKRQPSLNAKQKRQVIALAKSFQGKGPQGDPGAAGAAGTNGTNGNDGANGADGANGQDGNDGKSVEVSGTAPGCTEGGATVQVEGEPATAQEVCNGPEGPEGPEGALGTAGTTLPSEATETGMWAVTGEYPAEQAAKAPISFPIPLSEADVGSLESHLLNVGEGETAECPGTVDDPQAASGHLCVYIEEAVGIKSVFGFLNALVVGLRPSGAIVDGSADGGYVSLWGSFAVTAP